MQRIMQSCCWCWWIKNLVQKIIFKGVRSLLLFWYLGGSIRPVWFMLFFYNGHWDEWLDWEVRVPVCVHSPFLRWKGDFYIKKCVFDVPLATPGLWFFNFFLCMCIGTSSLFWYQRSVATLFYFLFLENTDFFLSKRPTRAIEYGWLDSSFVRFGQIEILWKAKWRARLIRKNIYGISEKKISRTSIRENKLDQKSTATTFMCVVLKSSHANVLKHIP